MLKLFNREERYKRNIDTIEPPVWTEKINGENTLIFRTAETDIEEEERVLFKDELGIWHEFIIKNIEQIHNTHREYEVYCEDSFYETYGDYIDDRRLNDTTLFAAITVALEPTRWEVGIVDDLGKNSTNFYHVNVKEAVYNNILDVWPAEIRTRVEVTGNRITKRTVDLLNRRGMDYGKRFTYEKDINEIKRIIDTTGLYTALYGYGKGEEVVDEEGTATGGYGRRINFADINEGKKYVENLGAKEKYGRLDETRTTRQHIYGVKVFDQVESPEELKRLTEEELERASRPKITYEADVIVLKKYGYDHEGVELGDTVTVIDKDLDIRVKVRILERVSYVGSPRADEVVLANYREDYITEDIKRGNQINRLQEKSLGWDTWTEKYKGKSYLETIVMELNEKMNAQGGYVYISEDGDGITTYNKPIDQNPTMAIQILGGAFRIANSKNPDGTWNWSTFGDGNGFTASLLVAGILKGGKVKFDLENGTFLIGESASDYWLYFDGSTLRLRNTDLDLRHNAEFTSLKNKVGEVEQSFTVTQGELQSQIAAIGDDLSVTESSITQLSNSITSKVSKNGIISAINQSAESIKIKASKINLEGDVSLQGEFKTYYKNGNLAAHLHGTGIQFYGRPEEGAIGSINCFRYIDGSPSHVTLGHGYNCYLTVGGWANAAIIFDEFDLKEPHIDGGGIKILDRTLFNYYVTFGAPVTVNHELTSNSTITTKYLKTIEHGKIGTSLSVGTWLNAGGNITCSGYIKSDGVISGSAVSTSGSIAGNSLTVTTSVTAQNLESTYSTSVGTSLTVESWATVGGSLSVNSWASVSGSLTVTGYVNLAGGAIKSYSGGTVIIGNENNGLRVDSDGTVKVLRYGRSRIIWDWLDAIG